MNEILVNVLSIIVTSVVLPVIAYVSVKVTQFLNNKIKSDKTRDIISQIDSIIRSNVSAVYQTYVQKLKEDGKFDVEAQNYALRHAKERILDELSSDIKEYIFQTYGDLSAWLTTQIETCIYQFKNHF